MQSSSASGPVMMSVEEAPKRGRVFSVDDLTTENNLPLDTAQGGNTELHVAAALGAVASCRSADTFDALVHPMPASTTSVPRVTSLSELACAVMCGQCTSRLALLDRIADLIIERCVVSPVSSTSSLFHTNFAKEAGKEWDQRREYALTLLQHLSKNENRSRIIAANNIINALFMVAASIIIVILTKLNFSSSAIFLVIGIVNLGVAIYICQLLPDDLLKSFVSTILKVLYRVKVEGVENYLAASEKSIIVANHVSFLDGLLLSAFLPDKVLFAITTDMARKWWIKPILKLVVKRNWNIGCGC